MGKTPNFDPITDMKFITNYVLIGCGDFKFLYVTLSTEALADLALLLIGPSIDDLVQGVLSPSGSRSSRKGRHGRKSGRGFGFPDPNDLVAEKIKGRIGEYTPVRFGPAKYAWGGLQLYEGINFAAALVDGITNTKFNTLWGILNLSSSHCREFARLGRNWRGYGVSGGLGVDWAPMNINNLDFTVRFFDGNFGTGTDAEQWEIAYKVVMYGIPGLPAAEFNLQLRTDTGRIVAETGAITIEPGQVMRLEIAGEAYKDEFVTWGTTINHGNYAYLEADILAFADVNLL